MKYKSVTLTIEQWNDVCSALHETQREIVTEPYQRNQLYVIELEINKQLSQSVLPAGGAS